MKGRLKLLLTTLERSLRPFARLKSSATGGGCATRVRKVSLLDPLMPPWLTAKGSVELLQESAVSSVVYAFFARSCCFITDIAARLYVFDWVDHRSLWIGPENGRKSSVKFGSLLLFFWSFSSAFSYLMSLGGKIGSIELVGPRRQSITARRTLPKRPNQYTAANFATQHIDAALILVRRITRPNPKDQNKTRTLIYIESL